MLVGNELANLCAIPHRGNLPTASVPDNEAEGAAAISRVSHDIDRRLDLPAIAKLAHQLSEGVGIKVARGSTI